MTNEELIAEAEAWMDADYDHDPRVLPDLITALRKAELDITALENQIDYLKSELADVEMQLAILQGYGY